MKRNQWKQENIRLGTHGEDYGSWMSNPVFYIIGGIGVLSAVLAVLSFYVFHVAVLGVLFAIITIALVVLLIWITWIRRQYAFGGGRIMEQVHRGSHAADHHACLAEGNAASHAACSLKFLFLFIKRSTELLEIGNSYFWRQNLCRLSVIF